MAIRIEERAREANESMIPSAILMAQGVSCANLPQIIQMPPNISQGKLFLSRGLSGLKRPPLDLKLLTQRDAFLPCQIVEHGMNA